jgi:hypothetical protein
LARLLAVVGLGAAAGFEAGADLGVVVLVGAGFDVDAALAAGDLVGVFLAGALAAGGSAVSGSGTTGISSTPGVASTTRAGE